VTHHQFKKNTKNKSENNHTKSKKKKNLVANKTQARPTPWVWLRPGYDLPQTLPVLNRLKIRFNAQKPISNAQKLISNVSKLIFYLKLKPRG
jgi:hypothetical protein